MVFYVMNSFDLAYPIYLRIRRIRNGGKISGDCESGPGLTCKFQVLRQVAPLGIPSDGLT